MNTHTIDQTISDKWENGELGRSDEHVAVASETVHAELDRGLAMKLVSIRLPTGLIEALKFIADHNEIAYQPMVRDLLTRFARSEVKQIIAELDEKMRAEEPSAPVQAFIERERMAATG